MKIRFIAILFLLVTGLYSCQKDPQSPIPGIALTYFGPISGHPDADGYTRIMVNKDSCALMFDLSDGDGDIVTTGKDIHIRDMRYDSFGAYSFPLIDTPILNADHGIKGSCTFLFIPGMPELNPRVDSPVHYFFDTTRFEVYITDKAGHKSNHITTGPLIIAH